MDGKIFATLIGLIVAIAAVTGIKIQEDQKRKEKFLGNLPSMTWKVDRVKAANSQSAKTGDFYSVPGTYQSMLAPRAASVNYGANINYNLPSYKHQGIPRNPLTFGKMGGVNTHRKENYGNQRASGASHQARHNPALKEGYCACESCAGGCSGVPKCGTGAVSEYSYKGGAPVQEPGYANGNYNQVLDNTYSNNAATDVTSYLPVNDMTQISEEGAEAPVVYDRYMYANRSKRLLAQGDYFRGDLPIVPCEVGWFRPSVQPNIDLNRGAMFAMGGLTNDTADKLAKLVYVTSGGTETAIAGENLSHSNFSDVNMTQTYIGGLSANAADISVSAFP